MPTRLSCWRAARLSRWRAEIAGFLTPGPRMADEAVCIAAVFLAIVLAHAIGARMVGWAAFSAFILLKGDVAETLTRGLLRVAGTALGAGLALVVVPVAAGSLPLAMLAAAIVGAIGLYGMLTARRAYAWLLFGLTFEMILLDRIARPALDTLAYAQTRLLEVAAGTAACVAVSVAAHALSRKGWRIGRAAGTALGWHPEAARHAAQAGLALALLLLVNHVHAVPALSGAGVTIMAVMIVPAAGLGASGLAPVSRRLVQRAVGCVAGGALALAVLLIAQGQPAVLIAGTALGIAIGRHIENGNPAVTYIGLQFTLAILVALVPDSYAHTAIGPAVDRLIGIVVGMALLEPVLLAWHWLVPAAGRNGVADVVGRGEE